MDDPYNLDRFVRVQEDIYDQVVKELKAGEKRSHWMWFIFPQVKGLGFSPMAVEFAIKSRGEAVAYLEHPIVGARLRECTRLVNAIEGRTIQRIFGSPDDMKFRSSMTLFAEVAAGDEVFKDALEKYFGGEPDKRTLAWLSQFR